MNELLKRIREAPRIKAEELMEEQTAESQEGGMDIEM